MPCTIHLHHGQKLRAIHSSYKTHWSYSHNKKYPNYYPFKNPDHTESIQRNQTWLDHVCRSLSFRGAGVLAHVRRSFAPSLLRSSSTSLDWGSHRSNHPHHREPYGVSASKTLKLILNYIYNVGGSTRLHSDQVVICN